MNSSTVKLALNCRRVVTEVVPLWEVYAFQEDVNSSTAKLEVNCRRVGSEVVPWWEVFAFQEDVKQFYRQTRGKLSACCQ